MINIKDNIWKPNEEYKYISNGSIWATEILLGKNDSVNNWHDTNDEPPIPPEPEPQPSEEYLQGYDQAVLDMLGVDYE